MLALASALIAGPRTMPSRPVRSRRIGFLSSTPSAIFEGFQAGLRELHHVEGRNINIEWRWTQGEAERSFELAADSFRLEPDLMIAGHFAAAFA